MVIRLEETAEQEWQAGSCSKIPKPPVSALCGRAVSGVCIVAIVVAAFKVDALPRIVAAHMRSRISDPAGYAGPDAVVIALLIARVVFDWERRGLLKSASWWRVGRRNLAGGIQTAAEAGITTIISIPISHLGVGIKAAAPVQLVILELSALGIHLAVLPAAFKGHLVYLTALLTHFHLLLAGVWRCMRIISWVHVGLLAAGEQNGKNRQQQVFHASIR
jgi:hypothetical protein